MTLPSPPTGIEFSPAGQGQEAVAIWRGQLPATLGGGGRMTSHTAALRRFATWLGAVALTLLAPSTVLAADPTGVAFVTPTPFSISIAAGEAHHELSLVVFNGSPEARTITVRTLGLAGDDGEAKPSDDLVISSGKQQVLPGELSAPIVIMVERGKSQPGTYSGRLIATSTDGTIALADLTVSIAEPNNAQGGSTPAPDALRLPLPDKVPESEINVLPSPISRLLVWTSRLKGPLPCLSCWLTETAAITVSLPATDELAAAASPAILLASDGSRAVAEPSAQSIEISGFPGSGQYDGKMSFGKDTSTTLTVSVRDLILWPALVLAGGLLAATWVDRRLSRQIPRARLRLALQTLKDKAVAAQEQADAAKPAYGDPIYRIWKGTEGQWIDKGEGALAVAARDAMQDFDENADAAKAASDWIQRGPKFLVIDTLVNDFQSLLEAVGDLHLSFADLRLLDETRWHEIREEPAAIKAQKALVGVLLKQAADVKTAFDFAREADDLIAAFSDAYTVIKRWLGRQTDEAKKRELARELNLLRTGHMETRAAIEEVKKAAGEYAPDESNLESQAQPGAIVRFGARGEQEDLAPINVADLTKALDGQERFAQWAAGFLVLLSGLSALYFTNATFGSLGDYLGVFLWGSVVGTGVTIARRLGPLAPGALNL